MKHNHPINVLLSIFSVILIFLGVLYGIGQGMIVYKQSASQKSILRGVESISAATMAVADDFSRIYGDEVESKYDACRTVVESHRNTTFKESQLRKSFHDSVLEGFLSDIGGEENIASYIEQTMPQPETGKLSIDKNSAPYVNVTRDNQGDIIQASIRNVTFVYDGIPGIQRTETVRFDLIPPNAIFNGGDEKLFDFCMVSGQGIYATGATSSFVGDIYAGVHKGTESRDIEVSYGEIGIYGGINFMSTQIGVEAGRILSRGDINLNGSFAIFNPEGTDGLKCYAHQIRKMRGYSGNSMYSLNGDFIELDAVPEKELEELMQLQNMVEDALGGIAEIPFFYDSNNDKNFDKDYRKIVSSEDVEIGEDITGFVFSAGNVIVKAGCNVEGMIMCADRIYLQGNNNIVSNAGIVNRIVADELAESLVEQEIEYDDGASLDAEAEQSSGIVYRGIDYIGGFTIPGLERQNVYVYPYQE